jgi:hypothetical protein
MPGKVGGASGVFWSTRRIVSMMKKGCVLLLAALVGCSGSSGERVGSRSDAIDGVPLDGLVYASVKSGTEDGELDILYTVDAKPAASAVAWCKGWDGDFSSTVTWGSSAIIQVGSTDYILATYKGPLAGFSGDIGAYPGGAGTAPKSTGASLRVQEKSNNPCVLEAITAVP